MKIPFLVIEKLQYWLYLKNALVNFFPNALTFFAQFSILYLKSVGRKLELSNEKRQIPLLSATFLSSRNIQSILSVLEKLKIFSTSK